jgi:hypothetical protein
MQWDLGLRGLGLLVAMSFGFGVIAQLVVGRATTRWLWLLAAAGYFVGGLFTSEVWFGWATQEELQPNIDGLSFDEVQGRFWQPSAVPPAVVAHHVLGSITSCWPQATGTASATRPRR